MQINKVLTGQGISTAERLTGVARIIFKRIA